jgi:hypothetical protein
MADFKVGHCGNCGEKDTAEHAFVTCPDIQKIWKEATGVLERLVGRTRAPEDRDDREAREGGRRKTDTERTSSIGTPRFDTSEIIQAFPKFRESLPKARRHRVVLWHSAIIFVITELRKASLTKMETRESVEYDFEGWKDVVTKEMGQMLWEICTDENNRKGFEEAWLMENQLIRYTSGYFVFTEGIGGGGM